MNGQTERSGGDQDPAVEVENADEQPETGVESAASEEALQDAAGLDPLAEAEARAEENWNNYLRAAAELENVRKRAAREVDNARKFAIERFGADLLAVCDSLEMGLATADTADAAQLLTGSENTLKLLQTTLQRFGIQEIDPLGEPFDPEMHEAMTMQPSETAEPGTVLTVFQKGYTLNGRLLRPARVVVSQEMVEKSD